jgi:hypothetical protein
MVATPAQATAAWVAEGGSFALELGISSPVDQPGRSSCHCAIAGARPLRVPASDGGGAGDGADAVLLTYVAREQSRNTDA